MAKKRTINEIRQTKEYYTGNEKSKIGKIPTRTILCDNAGEYYADNSEPVEKECPLDPVEEAKILIVNKITKHFHDVMFEMVNEEMMNNRLFQSQNYLTDEGYELFEDEYFQFYHEHHGDILYEVMKNITN